jgi:RNA polymerase sigma-70 factor (ECF subfamily)
MDASVTFRFPSLAGASERESLSAITSQSNSASAPSDEALMALVCNGDGEALGTLFRRYFRVVHGIASRVLRDRCEADDLVQDVFLLVHRLCKTFNSTKGSAQFWILQMAYRRAISRRRFLSSRHFYTAVDVDDVAAELTDPETGPMQLNESIDLKVENGRVQTVFATLSADQRQTLHLFFMEGDTLDEIAAKLGQPRGNIKHHYFRGLERLRKELFGSKLPGERSV